MSKQLRELQARKATLVEEARSLTDGAAAESRDLSEVSRICFDAAGEAAKAMAERMRSKWKS